MERLDARLREISPGGFHELIAKISAIDEFRGWWKGRGVPSSSVLRHLKARAVESSAAASTRIDGREAGRSHAAVQNALRANRMLRTDSHDPAQVTGYAELLRAVFDGYGDMQFGTDLVLQFHARLLKYSHKDRGHRGKFKTIPDAATPPWQRRMELLALRSVDPDLTPRAMTVATEWTARRLATSEFHPLLVIAGFILEFLAIRPFASANGRLSRILTNFLLLQCGYTHVPYASLEKVIAERWTEYYFALRRSQMNANLPRPDITPWLSAFLDAIRVQIAQLRAVVEGRPDNTLLSENQLGVLDLLERHGEVTNRLVADELGLPKDTAKQVLNRLLALNLVQRLGAGRAVRYRRAPLQGSGSEAR